MSSQSNNSWMYKRDKVWERIVMSRGSIVLLCHGDRLRLCDGTVFAYHSTHVNQSISTHSGEDELRDLEKESFSNLYHITKCQLGAGGTATVFMAVDRLNRKQVACKIVKLKSSGLDQIFSHHFEKNNRYGLEHNIQMRYYEDMLRREVDMLKALSHPNIIQLQRVFYSNVSLYIIEDLITGGDLASYIDQEQQKTGAVGGEDACGIVYQITQALKYLHKKGIVHRDLKPENVLLSVPAVGARVLLTDFGGAAGDLRTRPRRLNTYCGTVEWLAPEVARKAAKGYTQAVDMWSLGCLITALFLGSSVFAIDDEGHVRHSTSTIIAAAAQCDLSILDNIPAWRDVDPHAKDLTKTLIRLDEEKRSTAEKALGHEWFRSGHRDIDAFYKAVKLNWKSIIPDEHYFEEDLKVFIQAGIEKDDVKDLLITAAARDAQRTAQVTDQTRPRLKPMLQASRPSKVRDSSFMEAPDDFDFGSSGRSLITPVRKRKTTVRTDPEDHALRTKAWAGNRGLISAKDYNLKIAEKKNEANRKT
ncbi:MAG: hypothetical protein Q9195_001137 [Heterodermia aff. obscurata]